ncbi:hypothetical protein [Caballeronia zhejiangensis]|uniref:Holin n=1 Tax=Caballeronia zhejiangensis TaxID=871203 RepID=A0A656QC69_9BURK|nr:hypothetical protein [Caballeronia zhejiangensis]KDR26004.1 hypothetical protein BG60_26545 [Caballeronia zhejiangensis]
MKLIDDASAVWHRLWSVRFAILSALFGIAAQVQDNLPAIRDFVTPKEFVALSIVCGLASALSRVIKQPSLTGGNQ